MYPVSFRDKTGRLLISDVVVVGADTGSGFLFITSASADSDGMFPVSFRGRTGRVLVSDAA